MEVPPAKKRVRVKVNNTTLSEPPYVTPESEHSRASVSQGKITPPREQTDDCNGYNENNERVNVEKDEIDANQLAEIENKTDPPLPAPRRRSKPFIAQKLAEQYVQSDSNAEILEINEKTEAHLPEGQGTKLQLVENELNPKEQLGRKNSKTKRKAAEVMANVLRRESKKVSQVATIFQQSLGKEKHKVGDSNPWDSPSPPTSLEKVYIQHKHGYTVQNWSDFYNKLDTHQDVQKSCSSAVDVALTFHGIWTRMSTFSHGVVAGVAGCHTLTVTAALAATQNNLPDFVQFYHFLSLKVHFAIYVLTTLCVVSCLDKLDVGQVSINHMRTISGAHSTLLVTVCYLLSMALNLITHRHSAAIEAFYQDHSLWTLQEWICLVASRDVLLLLCWVLLTCSKQTDLLRDKLLSMGNTQTSSEQPRYVLSANVADCC